MTRRAERIRAFLIPLLFVVGYVFFWNAPRIHLRDPWYEAFNQVTAAMKTPDPVQKQRLLDQGGSRLSDLCRKYPHHARVQYMLGCYYEYTGNYDSAIVHAREAIRLGSGATVNQVDGMATELLKEAIAKKAGAAASRQAGRQ